MIAIIAPTPDDSKQAQRAASVAVVGKRIRGNQVAVLSHLAGAWGKQRRAELVTVSPRHATWPCNTHLGAIHRDQIRPVDAFFLSAVQLFPQFTGV